MSDYSEDYREKTLPNNDEHIDALRQELRQCDALTKIKVLGYVLAVYVLRIPTSKQVQRAALVLSVISPKALKMVVGDVEPLHEAVKITFIVLLAVITVIRALK